MVLAKTQLTSIVLAPAKDSAFGVQGEDMLSSRCDLRYRNLLSIQRREVNLFN